jgi:hypothetical protein
MNLLARALAEQKLFQIADRYVTSCDRDTGRADPHFHLGVLIQATALRVPFGELDVS